VFAAYTAPDGGITSISKLEDRLSNSMQEADHSEDFDFIDLDDFTSCTGSNKRRPSVTDIPSEIEYGISKSTITKLFMYNNTKNYNNRYYIILV
jgi:hypothetical protein